MSLKHLIFSQVIMEGITLDPTNLTIIRRIRENDPDFKKLRVTGNENRGDISYYHSSAGSS